MAEDRPTILLVGCGKMGGALLEGWLARAAAAPPVHVVEPGAEARARYAGRADVRIGAEPAALPAALSPSVVVFATKPQGMEAVVPQYRRYAEGGALFLSIAAGKRIGFFAGHLGAGAAIIRAMPNTPAQVGRGITVLAANARVTPAQRALAGDLLAAVGEVAWVEDESLMDAVTAVSGSGPAYVFLLAETLARAGAAAGLPPDLAAHLARATVAGSGELLHRAGESPATLRQNVTSPGGTTAAALSVLMAPDGLERLMTAAVAAATRRSRELAG